MTFEVSWRSLDPDRGGQRTRQIHRWTTWHTRRERSWQCGTENLGIGDLRRMRRPELLAGDDLGVFGQNSLLFLWFAGSGFAMKSYDIAA